MEGERISVEMSKVRSFFQLGTLIKIGFRVAEISTVISLVLVEFVTDRFQKKFHQVNVATEADHVVDVQDHVTVAPAQEYNHYWFEL